MPAFCSSSFVTRFCFAKKLSRSQRPTRRCVLTLLSRPQRARMNLHSTSWFMMLNSNLHVYTSIGFLEVMPSNLKRCGLSHHHKEPKRTSWNFRGELPPVSGNVVDKLWRCPKSKTEASLRKQGSKRSPRLCQTAEWLLQQQQNWSLSIKIWPRPPQVSWTNPKAECDQIRKFYHLGRRGHWMRTKTTK